MLAAHVGGGGVGRAKGHHRRGLLGVQPPIDKADQGLGHVLDDGGATRRTGGQSEFAALTVSASSKDQGGRHRTAWPLQGRNPVGNGRAGAVGGRCREVGQLVVQQEAAPGHVKGTKARLDGGGHRHHVAVAVHHRDLGGAVFWRRPVDAQRRRGGQRTGQRRAHAAGEVDQAGAAAQVGGVQHGRGAAAGQRHKVGVGHKFIAVGVGQALGFGHQVHAKRGGLAAVDVQRGGLVQRQVKVLQDAQSLRHRQATAAGWRHATHPDRSVGRANSLPLDRPVGRQVRQRGLAGRDAAAGVVDFVDDVLGDGTTVKGCDAAIGNGLESGRQGRAGQQRAADLGGAIGIEEVGPRLRVTRQRSG